MFVLNSKQTQRVFLLFARYLNMLKYFAFSSLFLRRRTKSRLCLYIFLTFLSKNIFLKERHETIILFGKRKHLRYIPSNIWSRSTRWSYVIKSYFKSYQILTAISESATPVERSPTGIDPGAPSLQHLHPWPANHRLQKVCICRRCSNYACWWRLAGTGRGADQGHGNHRWIPPDLEAKAQHHKDGFGSLPPQQQRSWTWAQSQIQQRNPALLLRAQVPRSNVGQVACVSPTPCVTSQEAAITRHAPEAAFWLRLVCWSNNSVNSHPSLGAFNRRVLSSCLVPQCSFPPYLPRHQRRLANCEWMAASCTSGQPSNSRRHPTCWVSSQWRHTVS